MEEFLGFNKGSWKEFIKFALKRYTAWSFIWVLVEDVWLEDYVFIEKFEDHSPEFLKVLQMHILPLSNFSPSSSQVKT